MSAKNKGVLDASTLQHIATHAVANAHALFDEARMLYDHERWARAGALAVLAVEESGKAHLCHVWWFHAVPTLDDPADAEAWQPFWDGFTDHPGKIDAWLSHVDGIGECADFGEWNHEATVSHLSKLKSLYVDYDLPEKQVTTPDPVTEDDARQFMDIAADAIAWWERVGWVADTGS